MNHVNHKTPKRIFPMLYMEDVIARMPYMTLATHDELAELLPHNWKLRHPEGVMPKLRDEV